MSHRNIFLLSLMAFFTLLAVGCGEKSSSEQPQEVVKVLYQRLDEGSIDKVMEIFSLSELEDSQKAKAQERLNQIIQNAMKVMKNNGGLDKIEIISEKIGGTGKRATIEVKVVTMGGEGGQETIYLKQEESKWKVVNIK